MNKPREGWVSYNGVNDREMKYASFLTKKPSGISGGGMNQSFKVREVLPEEITDTQRLEYMIKHPLEIEKEGDYWVCENHTRIMSYSFDTPRAAIDAAIRQER